MRSIAIYGKGGIGKSTITANLSVALAAKGYKVLQIGCDPKHDSTRLLLGGFTQSTVLELLKAGSASPCLADLVMTGYKGIKCIEAGGPEPGVGCAGRGIISMAGFLKTSGLNLSDFDFVIYDVLGDVVCGGFGVPMRNEYSNEIYVVSSGELMSIYAANNIAKGIRNYSNPKGKLAGIIGNARGVKNEDQLLEEFARRLGTRLLTIFPRNELFREAELNCMTIMEYAPQSEIADWFRALAEEVIAGPRVVLPSPIEEDELVDLNLQFTDCKVVRARPKPNRPTVASTRAPIEFSVQIQRSRRPATEDMVQSEPLHGCTLGGAHNVTSQVKDCISIMHSPAGCAYMSIDGLMSVGARGGMDAQSHLLPNLLSTSIDEKDVVFGGEKHLEALIREAHGRLRPEAFFLITSCPVSIIGDNWDQVVSRLRQDGIKVIPIQSEGVIGGDYQKGMMNAYRALAAEFIDPGAAPQKGWVNVVGERNTSKFADRNFAAMKEIFDALGLKVNCRFVRDTSTLELRNFLRGELSILAADDPLSAELKQMLSGDYGSEFLDRPFPVGFEETKAFVEALAERYGTPEPASKLVTSARERYEHSSARLKKALAGRTVMIFSYAQNLDWLIGTLLDLKVRILKVCVYDWCAGHSFRSKYAGEVELETDYPAEKRRDDILAKRPDLVLTNYVPKETVGDAVYDVIPLSPLNGFYGPLEHAKRWVQKIRVPFQEGWREDAKLFDLAS